MRQRRFSLRRMLWLLPVVATAFATVQAQNTYSGRLDGRLHIQPEDGLTIVAWDESTPTDANKLGLLLRSDDLAFIGKITLPGDPLIEFDGAVVRSADGIDVLYVDLNKDGRFEDNEKSVFETFYTDEHNKKLKNHTRIEIPLASGPFKSCPIEVLLPKQGALKPVGPKQTTVLYAKQPYVEGYSQLPGRTLLMRFALSLKNNAINLDHDMEWADLNDDGSIDALTPGSPEILKPMGKPPIFRVGKLVLSAQSVDLATNSFVLRTVSPKEYNRIDLVVGSTVPDFAFTDFDGKTRHLSEIKAKYLLLDFWSTTCAPCVADLPSKVKVYEGFHGRGFEILGMDGDETIEKPKRLLNKMKIAWPQARYEKELFDNKFQITIWPTLVLIDEHHKIVAMGDKLKAEELSKTLKALFQ